METEMKLLDMRYKDLRRENLKAEAGPETETWEEGQAWEVGRIWENVDFSYSDLRGQDLSGLQFRNCYFTRADLRQANLRDAQFHDCRFIRAQMDHVVAARAEFRGANLEGANLDSADFTRAILGAANLSGVWARNAVFASVHAHRMNAAYGRFDGAVFTTHPAGPQTILTECSFVWASLVKARMEYCDVSRSHFQHADLTDMLMTHTNAAHCDFSDAHLDGVKARFTNVLGARGSVATASFSGYIAVAMGRTVSIGCRVADLDDWLENGRRWGRESELPTAEIEAYLAWLRSVRRLLKAQAKANARPKPVL